MSRLRRIKTFRDREDHREDWIDEFLDIEQRVDAVRRVSSDLYKKMSSLSAADDEKRVKKAPLWPVKQEFENAEKFITSDTLLQSVFNQMRNVLNEISIQYGDHLQNVDNVVLVPLKNLEDDCKRLLKERKNLIQQYSELKHRRDQLPSDTSQGNAIASLILSSLTTNNSTSNSPQSGATFANPTGTPVANGQVSTNSSSTTTPSTSTTDGPSQKLKELTALYDEATVSTNTSKDVYLKELYSFAACDRERSRIFMKYIELQREYHLHCYTKLSEQVDEMEELIKQKSIKTVFGVDLKTHLKETNRTIAYVLEVCVEALLNPHSIREQGIFRVSPGKSKVGHLLARLNVMPPKTNFLREFDPITIANALKNYIGKLPETLLGVVDPHLWQTAGEIDEKDSKRVEALRNVVKQMDPDHSANLAYLCQFLNRLTQFSSCNNMDAYNLSVVFAPNFFQGNSGLIGAWQLGVTKSLIEHSARIFPQSDDWLQKFDLDEYKPSLVDSNKSNDKLVTAANREIITDPQIPPKLTKSVDVLNESNTKIAVPLPSQDFFTLKNPTISPDLAESSRHVRNLSADLKEGLDISSDLPSILRGPGSRPPATHGSIRRSTTKKAPPPPPTNQIATSQAGLPTQMPPVPSLPPPPPPPTSPKIHVSQLSIQSQTPPMPPLPPPPPPPTFFNNVATPQSELRGPSLTPSPQLRPRASTEDGNKSNVSNPTPAPRRMIQSTLITDNVSPAHQSISQRKNLQHQPNELTTSEEKDQTASVFIRNPSLRIAPKSSQLVSEPLRKLTTNSPSLSLTASLGVEESNTNASQSQREYPAQCNPIPAFGRPKPVTPESKNNQPIPLNSDSQKYTDL